jgi:malto-oligosyltrehalose trehalohydrolase
MQSDRRSPFGVELTGSGASFRLWAPDADRPDLLLGDRNFSMKEAGDGFYEAFVEDAAAGDAYAFRVAGHTVPDPASLRQEGDVHRRSVIYDPHAFQWSTEAAAIRPFSQAVIYECHVGTMTEKGTFLAIADKLDHLERLGVNTIELMPVAQFSGSRGWGYDGVLPYAPHNTYGTPDDLKTLIDTCHQRGFAVMLDVVYNHFGPDGNYLHLYADSFFDKEQHTPWGAGLDFSAQPVRDFFIHNALMWLRDYRFDGLRFDAVHAIPAQAGDVPFLIELAERIEGALPGRKPYLVLENDDNAAHLIGPGSPYTAQWNDDIHHVLHRLASGETDGYYGDYEDEPVRRLSRALAEGFVYQGEPSPHRGGKRRGEPSAGIHPSAFVSFIQNHDQVGNRAEGERLSDAAPVEAVKVVTAAYLLSPQTPMLWMGEEWAASSRFPFFCDFHGELADAVREGRRREFAQFKRFRDEKAREAIPDPNEKATFDAAKLDWAELEEGFHSERFAMFRQLLELRRNHVLPLTGSAFRHAEYEVDGTSFQVIWHFDEGVLAMRGQMGGEATALPPPTEGQIFATIGADEGSSASWWLSAAAGS